MRRWLSSALVAASALVLAACGGPLKYNVPSSRLAPGGDAEIVANVNEGQNQTTIERLFLPLPPTP